MSGTVIIVLLAIIAFLLYRFVRIQIRASRVTAPSSRTADEDNVFSLDNDKDDLFSGEIDLDVDFNYRRLASHFLLKSRYDTHRGKSLYEYRIDGAKVFFRMIEDEDEI
jgi:hypothetical protein